MTRLLSLPKVSHPENAGHHSALRQILCETSQRRISYFTFYPRDVVSAVYATATWPAGWVSVTRWYCVKTAKPILKLFRPPGSPIILVSSDPCADTQFQGEPLQRGR